MACCQPFKLLNPQYMMMKNHNWYKKYFTVPCGYCLNCRVDKRNWLEDCCNANYKHFGYGAFITLTYTDSNILDKLRTTQNGELVATLQCSDFQKFSKRFREYCNYHNLWTADVLDKDFDSLYVGEYGGNGTAFDRPHWHLLLFGCDYDVVRDIVKKCWNFGRVDCGPILSGGIRYVLKYLDKQVHGKQAVAMYDDNGLERPKARMSKGFYNKLILKQIDDIKARNYTSYIGKHKTERPLPSYLKNKFMAIAKVNNRPTIESMLSDEIPFDRPGRYSLKAMNLYKMGKANIREYDMCNMARASGIASFSFSDMKNIHLKV